MHSWQKKHKVKCHIQNNIKILKANSGSNTPEVSFSWVINLALCFISIAQRALESKIQLSSIELKGTTSSGVHLITLRAAALNRHHLMLVNVSKGNKLSAQSITAVHTLRGAQSACHRKHEARRGGRKGNVNTSG